MILAFLFLTYFTLYKKLGIKLSHEPTVPLLGIYPEETNWKTHLYSNVHCSTIYNSQDTEVTKVYF